MDTLLEKQDVINTVKDHGQFQDHEGDGTGQVIVDVRTPGEFEEVHIPGSRNIPLTDLKRFLPELQEIARNRGLTLICRTQNRAKFAYNELYRHGVKNCHILKGGVTQWIAEGKPVIHGEKGISVEGQVRIAAGTLIIAGIVLGVAGSPWLLVIPAAVGAGLIHAGWTDSCLMGMLLSKLSFNRV